MLLLLSIRRDARQSSRWHQRRPAKKKLHSLTCRRCLEDGQSGPDSSSVQRGCSIASAGSLRPQLRASTQNFAPKFNLTHCPHQVATYANHSLSIHQKLPFSNPSKLATTHTYTANMDAAKQPIKLVKVTRTFAIFQTAQNHHSSSGRWKQESKTE